MTSVDHPLSALQSRRPGLFGRTRECDELRACLADALGGTSRLVCSPAIRDRQDPAGGRTGWRSRGARRDRRLGSLLGGGRRAGLLAVDRDPPRLRARLPVRLAGGVTRPAIAARGRVRRAVPSGPDGRRAAAAPDAGSEHPGDRFHVFDAVATFLGAAAAQVPLVLILDDAHAADLPSLLLLRFVARALRKHQLLIVVTYRETEVRRHPQLAEIVADLGREGITLPLRGLSEGAVHEWVASGIDHAVDRSTAAAVHRVTDGNPFFVSEIVRLLASTPRGADGGVDAAALNTFGIPDGVRVAIRQRVALASADAQRALTVGAVVGREFDVALLRDAVDLPPPRWPRRWTTPAPAPDRRAAGGVRALPLHARAHRRDPLRRRPDGAAAVVAPRHRPAHRSGPAGCHRPASHRAGASLRADRCPSARSRRPSSSRIAAPSTPRRCSPTRKRPASTKRPSRRSRP
jgi:hypothetical protein